MLDVPMYRSPATYPEKEKYFLLQLLLQIQKSTKIVLFFSVLVMPTLRAFKVPIGGSYRLIDVPMSNCINSGINKVYILTQFNSASLNRHIARAYNGGGASFGDGYVEVYFE